MEISCGRVGEVGLGWGGANAGGREGSALRAEPGATEESGQRASHFRESEEGEEEERGRRDEEKKRRREKAERNSEAERRNKISFQSSASSSPHSSLLFLLNLVCYIYKLSVYLLFIYLFPLCFLPVHSYHPSASLARSVTALMAEAEIDLYEVLEVSRTASKDEIRKAYRKAALASHPDKVPEAERDEAEVKFKSVQEAYDILYDEEKREVYDNHGMGAFNGAGEPGMNPGGPDLDDILAQMFGMGGGMGGMPGGAHPGRNKSRRSPNEEQKYEVSMEDLYKGKSVKFASTKNIICSLCNGKGGKEKAKAKQCSTCGGQGFKEVLQQMGQFLTPSTITCSTCNGNGEFFSPKDKCKKCKGKKTVEAKKILEIYVPPGAKEGDKIVLEGEADQLPDKEPGDIVFHIVEEEHKTFTRAGADLSATIDINLAESLTGFHRVVIKHLDGRGIELKHPQKQGQVLSPGQVLKVTGEGMPIKRSDSRGDLYLKVNIVFPDEKWTPSPAVLEKLREMLPKPGPAIQADPVDEREYDAKANMAEFGSKDPSGASAWEDDDEGEGAQCTTQ